MNNYHFLSKMLVSKVALTAILSAAAVSTAVSQQMDAQPLPTLEQQVQPTLPLINNDAEPSYVLPDGASLSDANTRLQELSSEGARSLQSLVGSSVSNEREMNDIEARARDTREIERLRINLEKAKIAKELYQTINGEDQKLQAELDAVKAERDQLSEQLKMLETQLINTTKLVAQQNNPAPIPNPVIVSITGAAGDLTAKLLVPVTGEVLAKRGDVLSNGQVITSIGPRTVTVSKDGKSSKLAFGTSVASR